MKKRAGAIAIGILAAALVFVHAPSGYAQANTSSVQQPCVGFLKPLPREVGWCRTAPDDPYCQMLGEIFPQCKRNNQEARTHRIQWSADGVVLPTNPKEPSFFFSLWRFQDGRVSANVTITVESVDDLYSRYYIGPKGKDIHHVLRRIHLSRARVSSVQCPELLKLARELENMKTSTVSAPGIVMDGTDVTMWISSGMKQVIIETVEINNPLLKWIKRLRKATEPFLPKPKPLCPAKK